MFKYTIWPENKIRLSNFLKFGLTIPKTYKIEFKLKSMFPSGYPVLCSSGRAAINMALYYKDQTRPDFIGVNSYSSHCVLDSISRIATPIKWNPDNKDIKNRLIYHQWGYVQKEDITVDSIDDCVDSLCEKGTNLFPTSKTFEIWSLPKILGISSGAILWCKNDQIAKEIINIRNKRGGGTIYWILRMIGLMNKNFYWFWQGIAPEKGKLSLIELFEINNAIDKWDFIVNDRKMKLDLLWKFAPKWIKKPENRLPCVIPLEFENYKYNKNLNDLEIEVKHFVKITNGKTRDMIKVFPLPIHHDIPIKYLKIINNFLY